MFKPVKLKLTIENPEVDGSPKPKQPEEPPTVKKIPRPANLTLAEQRRLRKQKKSSEFAASAVDLTADVLADLKSTVQSTAKTLVAESLDDSPPQVDWKAEQTTDRARLEDLSLEKKRIRLKKVERTFKLVEDLVRLDESDCKHAEIQRIIETVQSSFTGFKADHANKRVSIELIPDCARDSVQQAFYNLLPLTITSEIETTETVTTINCEFGSAADCELAVEILTIIKAEDEQTQPGLF